jgi:hypothetical protein
MSKHTNRPQEGDGPKPAWRAVHVAVDREIAGDFDGAEKALLEALSRIRQRRNAR